jgi:hypothetical protein
MNGRKLGLRALDLVEVEFGGELGVDLVVIPGQIEDEGQEKGQKEEEGAMVWLSLHYI